MIFTGKATLINSNVYLNRAGTVVSSLCGISLIALQERYVLASPWQGGGLHLSGVSVGPGGTATLINTNVYENHASYVCSSFELSLSYHSAPSGTHAPLNCALVVGSAVGESIYVLAARQR